ncbi:MAG: hypothetical protein U5J83_05660 [Bryobacterales bacterium]|nr:hypothetical protein [Bryobacterales bacterium]
MEIPYRTLLQLAFALWWRFLALWLAVCATLAGLLLGAPQLLETLPTGALDRDFVFLGILPALELLLCYPLAVRWFSQSRAAQLGLHLKMHPPASAAPSAQRSMLAGWSLFFMPFAWELINALLIHALFDGSPESARVWIAIAAIYGNVMLLQWLAFMPMNLNWALTNRFFGIEWKLAQDAPPAP